MKLRQSEKLVLSAWVLERACRVRSYLVVGAPRSYCTCRTPQGKENRSACKIQRASFPALSMLDYRLENSKNGAFPGVVQLCAATTSPVMLLAAVSKMEAVVWLQHAGACLNRSRIRIIRSIRYTFIFYPRTNRKILPENNHYFRGVIVSASGHGIYLVYILRSIRYSIHSWRARRRGVIPPVAGRSPTAVRPCSSCSERQVR